MMRTLAFCLACFLFVVTNLAMFVAQLPVPQYANFPPENGEYNVIILRVIDGDTVEIGFIVKRSLRLSGINAPEPDTLEGIATASALSGELPKGLLTTVDLKGKEKFGRLLGRVKTKTGVDASKWLIDNKHAMPWDGKGKRP